MNTQTQYLTANATNIEDYANNNLPSAMTPTDSSALNSPWSDPKVIASGRLLDGLKKQCNKLRIAGYHRQATELTVLIRRINNCCTDYIKFRLPGKPNKKKKYPFFCHHKLCPICFPKQSREDSWNVFLRLYTVIKPSPMPNAVNPMYGIFTFSPKNPSLEEFTNFINKLKKSPTKVFNPKNNE